MDGTVTERLRAVFRRIGALAAIMIVLAFLMGVLVGKTTPSGGPVALPSTSPTSSATAVATATATRPVASPIPARIPTRRASPTRTPTPRRATATPGPPAPTNTPGPLPPTPNPPAPITKVTKMGVGVYLHGGGYVLNRLIEAQPTVILLQDPDLAFAHEVRAWFPKAFIIGRLFLTGQPLENPAEYGAGLADRVAEVAVPLKGVVDAWQGYNEPIGHDDFNGYRLYNKFQVAFAQRLQDGYGIAAVGGNDPPGAIEPADYAKYFSEAIRASRYFGIHSYAGPDANTFQTHDAQYFALRYRLIHNQLEAAGVKNVKMVLTEVALGKGWREHISDDAMASEFMWLADEMEKDPYVLGMAIFGMFNDPVWQPYNIIDTSVIERIGGYQPRR